MIRATRLEHVNLGVTDIDRSVDFYQQAFGWHVRWKGTSSGGARAAHVGNDAFYVAMFERVGGDVKHNRTADVGINHFGFVVEDMDGAIRDLRAAGFDITSDDSYDPGRHVYLLDPDGIEIELVEYAESEVANKTAADRA
jgi:catechol 2,3-dioxygenase-like lactoylglutathione lyase family enzyme